MVTQTFSWPKKAFFGCALAGVLLVLLAGALECGLRWSGYGHAPGFWRREKDAQGTRWIRENWWVTTPFFAPELVRRPQPFRLAEKKPENTYRIFVLGSSAAMGDPEPSFSIARALEVLLRTAYPKINFEVVNAGITAINSHVVRGIAADCGALQPDLFIVYEGNNEVIGPFGPATVFTPVLRSPLAIRGAVFLRGLRLGQAISALARRLGKTAGAPEEWGGMQMFLQHQVAEDDPRLRATERLFEDNLRAIAQAGTRAGARVILSTVLTNQRDFAPFQSGHQAQLESTKVDQWRAEFEAGAAAAKTPDWRTAEAHFRAAVALDEGYAESHFRLARVLLRGARMPEAKTEFARARDLDLLRFRTDTRLNQTIRRVAETAGNEVELVDLEKAAEGQTPGGILGDEMLYEHVHLSFRGTYLIAKELFRAATNDLRQRGLISNQEASGPLLSSEEVRGRLAFTTYEQAMIVKEMIARLKRPPFTDQSTNPERIAGYVRRDEHGSQVLSRPESADGIVAVYEQALTARPDDWMLHRNFGMALVALKRAGAAKTQLTQALEIIPDDPDTLFALTLAYRQLGETVEAGQGIDRLRRLAPTFPGLSELQ